MSREQERIRRKLEKSPVIECNKVRQNYYVDKTGLIIELLENWGKVNLITRPRRFGKSLNMNMLKTFFEINAEEKLFHGLKISEDTELCEKYMGRYPVIYLSLKDVNGRDYDSAYSSLCMIISEEARRIYRKYDLSENKNLMEAEKVLLEGMLTGTYDNESQLAHSLRFLSQILHMQCGKKVIILATRKYIVRGMLLIT